jgi:hypothetical protein
MVKGYKPEDTDKKIVEKGIEEGDRVSRYAAEKQRIAILSPLSTLVPFGPYR